MVHLLLFLFAARITAALPFFTNSTVPANLSPGCTNSLLTNIAGCSPVVAALRKGEYYPQDLLQTICTSTCDSDLAAFHSAVQSACAGELWTGIQDNEMPVLMIPELLMYNFALVCLSDSGRFCNVLAAEQAALSDPKGIHPVTGEPIANNTAPADPCDLCFIKQLRFQAGSAYYNGPQLRASSLYESKTSSCEITGYPLTVSDPVFTAPVPTTTDTPPSTCTGATYNIAPGDDCHSISLSQGIGTGWLLADNGLTADCVNFPTTGTLCLANGCSVHTVATSDTCESISRSYQITVAQLKGWNPIINAGCYNLPKMIGSQICVSVPGTPYTPPPSITLAPSIPLTPAPIPTDIADQTNEYCGKYYQVRIGEYCNLLVLKYAISLSDFSFLNPAINENCTNLFAEESYCVQAVGDINTYSGHPNSKAAEMTVTPTSLTQDVAMGLPDATYTKPPPRVTSLPLAVDTRWDCSQLFNGALFLSASHWTSPCEFAAAAFGVSLEELGMWNPVLGNTSLAGCSFEPNVQYCGKYYSGERLEPSGPDSNLPIREGTTVNCTHMIDIIDGMSCQDVLADYEITISQFYQWNLDVGVDCTGLWLGYQYCVDGPSPTTTPTGTTTTTLTSTPTPTGPPGQVQDGQPLNCNKWHVVIAGDTCAIVENVYFLTHAQFLLWNPAVSEDCVSGFWPEYYYCVGTTDTISSTRVSSPTAPTPTATTTPAPDPHQENNAISSCNEYAQAQSGQGCWDFATGNGITTEQLYAWNAVLGLDGSGCATMLWETYWYCVGVAA